MICKDAHKKMSLYLNQELDGKQLEVFESHLDKCNSCKQLLAEVKLTMEVPNQMKSLETDPFMFTRIQAQIENQAEARSKSWQKVLQPIAVSLVIIVSLFSGISLGSKYYNENVLSIEQNSTINDEDEIYFNVIEFESLETFLLTEE